MKQKIFFNIQYVLLVLIALTMPIHNWFFPKLFIFLIAAWIFEFDFKTKWKRLKENRLLTPFIIFAFLFLLYVVGMTYSTNIDFGVTDLILKAPILFAPLIIFSMDIKQWDFQRRKFLLLSFIVGCIIMTFISLFHSYSLLDNGWGIHNFLYTSTSCWFHPSYISMFYCFAILLITFFLIKFSPSKFEIITAFFIKALLITEIVLLSSKSGYLSLMLVLGFSIIFVVFVKNISRKKIFYPIISLLLFFVVFFALPTENNRFLISIHDVNNFETNENKVYQKVTHNIDSCSPKESLPLEKEKENDKNQPISSEINSITHRSSFARIQTWKNSFQLAIEKLPFGTGTGDIRDELTIVHQKNPITNHYTLNAHCQFLQVFATLGFLGIFAFLACFIVPFIFAWRRKYFLNIVFIAMIFINFLVESMLEVQAGVSFYAIFNGLLLLFATAHQQEKENGW
ncbi:MAG: O-antigen ligase family protein [Bacteroidales bacterium]|nr:O-antigen ligase family protein [Bacteroidales bacterium]